MPSDALTCLESGDDILRRGISSGALEDAGDVGASNGSSASGWRVRRGLGRDGTHLPHLPGPGGGV